MIASPENFSIEAPSRMSLAGSARPAEGTEGPSPCRNLYLKGRPTLKSFIHFVRSNAVHAPREQELAEEWKEAQGHIAELEKTEAGAAENPAITKLGPEYEPLLMELLKDPILKHSFNTVPSEIALVELDRLVVHQKHIDLTFVGELQKKLGPGPTQAEIFRTCLPYDHPTPPVKWCQVGPDRYVVMSPSNDLRFLGPMHLKPGQIRDYPPPGNVAWVLGLGVGFGSNFLNAIHAENRLILNNGSHRAYAMRAMGMTHVPCIIEHVSSREELEMVASSKVRREPDLYLKHPRPSMLRDYFNPRLHKVVEVQRQSTQIIVSFDVDEISVPAV